MPKGYFTPFTMDQEQKIKDEFLLKPVKRLADEVGTTYGRIMRFLKKNNLEIPRDLIEQRKLDSRKKKGNIPFNKGLKQLEYMSPEAIEKTKATRFKKGGTPHNTNKYGNGAIVIRKDSSGRPYQYYRIDKSVWELYHRVLWKNKFGEIPKGYLVVFKDGNSMNCEIDNLILITKKQNMNRNSIHRYPEHIKEKIRLISKINKHLKKVEL